MRYNGRRARYPCSAGFDSPKQCSASQKHSTTNPPLSAATTGVRTHHERPSDRRGAATVELLSLDAAEIAPTRVDDHRSPSFGGRRFVRRVLILLVVQLMGAVGLDVLNELYLYAALITIGVLQSPLSIAGPQRVRLDPRLDHPATDRAAATRARSARAVQPRRQLRRRTCSRAPISPTSRCTSSTHR